MDIEQEYIKSILHYDPITGLFTKLSNNKEPGYTHKGIGYRMMRAGGKEHPAHRLAFLYMTGSMPVEVDHINGVRDDNRWVNLRSTTRAENNRNKALYKNSASGICGVCWNKCAAKWHAHIKIDRKEHYLGYYDNIFDAACARMTAQNKLGLFSDRHGKES